MNYNVEQMRNAIQRYRDQTKLKEQQLKNVWDWYKEDVAAEEESRIRGEMRQQRINAESALYDAVTAATRQINKWATLDGNQLTADVRLLDVGVSPEQFQDLVRKHATNWTMLNALRTWGEAKNAEAAEGAKAAGKIPAAPYNLSTITDPGELVAEWKRLYDQACGMLDAIAGVGRYSDAFSRNFMLGTLDNQLATFGRDITMLMAVRGMA